MKYIHNTARGDERQSQSLILLPQSQIEMNAFKADYSHMVTAIDVPTISLRNSPLRIIKSPKKRPLLIICNTEIA